MPLTGLSADLHGTSSKTTSARRGSRRAIAFMIEQMFGTRTWPACAIFCGGF